MKNGRIKPLIAGLLIYLLIGLIYGWSIFVAPLEAEFVWSRTQTSAVFTISMIFFCLGGIVSGIIIKKKTARFILTVAAICLCVGFCCASSIHTVGGLYIAYGVLCGTGVGLAYNCNISTVLKWFPDRAGLISGLLLMCFGCGGMVLGTLASSLIQMIGWRITFVILGLLFAALILICAIWIKNPPENLFSRQEQDVREKSAILKRKKKAEKKHPETGVEMKTGQMLKRPAFWLHFIWATLLSAAGLAVIGHASVCAQDLGAAVGIATLITGLISVFNGIGRVVIGWIFDTMGRRTSVAISNLTMVFAFVLLVYAIGRGSLGVFMGASLILGFSYGSTPPVNSAFTNLFYGKKNYPLNFSFMNSNLIPASLLGPLVAGAVNTATGSYLTVFILLLVLSAGAFLLQLGVKKP